MRRQKYTKDSSRSSFSFKEKETDFEASKQEIQVLFIVFFYPSPIWTIFSLHLFIWLFVV